MRTDIDHQLASLLDKIGNPTSSDEKRTSGNPAVEQLPAVLPKLRKWLDNLNRLKR
jgi:hypothetical protein